MDINGCKALAYLLVAAALAFEEEQRPKRKKRKRRKDYIARSVLPSDVNLLRELENGGELADFRKYLRMDSQIFKMLLAKVDPYIRKQNTIMRAAIPSHTRLIATLRYLATGRSFEGLKLSKTVSRQSLGLIIMETCQAIQKALAEYIKVPESQEEWEKIADDFQQKWQFPNCLGAIDGKHVSIKKPPQGYRFYNYKGTYSVVLMAIVDANQEIIMADVGVNGRVSDDEVFKHTSFHGALLDNELSIPSPRELPESNKVAPFVFVTDEAFQLTTNTMKPYSLAVLNDERRVFNYRLSRARTVVENVFAILVSRFGVLAKPINLAPKKVNIVTLACCYLHNFLKKHSSDYDSNQQQETNTSNSEGNNGNVLQSSARVSCSEAKKIRDIYCAYFNNKGAVEWEENRK